MNYILNSLCVFIFLFPALSCKLIEINNFEKEKHDIHNEVMNQTDSILVINNLRLEKFALKDCARFSDNDKRDLDFLNAFINLYKIDGIDEKQLDNSEYYKRILSDNPSLGFIASDFEKHNYKFTSEKINIKNYGLCYIGKFNFSLTFYQRQENTYVIINIDKKELSIWDFHSLKFLDEGIESDFNIKGNHTINKIIYSEDCDSFVSINVRQVKSNAE